MVSRETYGESLRLLYLVTNKNMSMKKSILSFASILLLFSCGNNSSQTSSFQNSENSSFVVVDTMAEENIAENISAESASSSNLPYGYSKRRYTEYQPQNDIERRLFADLKEMTDATNKLDYKKVISHYYPDFFKYLQKQVPDKSIPEIKAKFENYLEQNLSERNKEYTNAWPEAKGVGLIVTNIMNRVKEGKGLLYLYEYHTFLYAETDTIVKDEAEYSIAASLNNGKKWYNSTNSIEENFEILGISFSREAIDKVLTKD